MTQEEEDDEVIEFFYHDPKTKTTNITDLIYPETVNYTIAEYSTFVRNNTFIFNSAGMKGTALMIQGLSDVVVLHNNFSENGPVY